ncbi:MAG: hypothetical protein JNM20_05210 [Rhizobiales bacterium]|nr:hypothetical protein [Hyphomicrobiales bacterium]
MAALFAGACLCAGGSLAAEPGDLDYVTGASLPPPAVESLAKFPQTANYTLSARLNPYYVQGDFDGDGKADTAVLVAETASGKHGIAFILDRRIEIVGAGKSIGNGGDDFAWMDAWYVYPKGAVEQGAFDEAPPVLRGDALMAIKTESASGLIYWDGSGFAWYQQGD